MSVPDTKVTNKIPASEGAGAGFYKLVLVDDSTKDQKDIKTDLKQVSPPIRAFRSAAVSHLRLGLKKMRITVPYSFTMSNTAGTGVINSVQPLNVDANTAEWAALSSLYDEYRLLGGRVMFQLNYTSPNIGTGLATDSMFVLAYDPTDTSALANVREGCELAQHTLVGGTHLVVDPIAGTKQVAYLPSTGKLHMLKFSTQRVQGPTVNISGAVNFTTGMWQSANASGGNLPQGALKVYGLTSNGSALSSVAGVCYLDLEFRSRK